MKNLTRLVLLTTPLALLGNGTFCSNSFLTVGANYTRASITPGGETNFDGNLGGGQALYEYRPSNDIYAGFEVAGRMGDTHGSFGTRNLTDINTDARLGYTWSCNQWYCTLYSGFGFRYFGQDLVPSATSPGSFTDSFFPPFLTGQTSLRFNYYEFYFPVALKTEYPIEGCVNVGLELTWSLQAFPTVSIDTMGGAFWQLTPTFGNVRVEVPFSYDYRRDERLALSPFYEHWQDGHSTARTSGGTPLGLPGNKYNFWGVNLNYTLAF